MIRTTRTPLALTLAILACSAQAHELYNHEGRIIGAIGISGVTSVQDGQIARAGAAAIANPARN